ncbi:MAG: hypothetical protein J2P26_00335, partial [Nocardiopsaceae bacterium]|nr:hypothetical protein [Nocardiopsaceae bacterium]
MIELPAPNTITRPYRGLSVQETDVPLTPAAIGDLLRGREIYRRTAFLVLRHRGQSALVAVRPTDPRGVPGGVPPGGRGPGGAPDKIAGSAIGRDPRPLFSPAAEVRVLSGPETTRWIDDPAVDVGNASALAAAAREHHRDGALAYVVQGKFEHVNFIWRPAPVPIHVTEVVPPQPPKLLAMAEQVVAYDEDLPPVELILDAVDVRDLAARHPAPHYLLPCRGSGIVVGSEVSFLDTRPAYHDDWLLIGCERSRQFYEHFYSSRPRQVDLCPRDRVTGGRVLAKCCLLERGVETGERMAVVPWGANLDEVRTALRALCGLPPAAEPRLDGARSGGA